MASEDLDSGFIANLKRKDATRWREKLQAGVVFAITNLSKVNGPTGRVMIALDGWDLHEIYTRLVEPEGLEGCCAGCTRLPRGWCAACDREWKNDDDRRNNNT